MAFSKRGKLFMNEYIINENTLAIVMIDKNTCMVIESENEFFINLSCIDVINNSCIYYGSSYEGRIEASKNLLGKDYKLPIIVSEFYDILLFPIGSKQTDICTWICLKKLDNYIIDGDMVEFIFKCNRRYSVLVGKKSFEAQLLKAYDLNRIIKNRCKNC